MKSLLSKVFVVLCGTLLSSACLAHEPFEITSTARIQGEQLTLNLLIADSTAAKLCLANAAPNARLNPAVFAAARATIEQCAQSLFRVQANEAALRSAHTELRLTEESDLDVTLSYRVPAGAVLRFEALLLQGLPDSTYGATLTVTGENVFLGQKLLRADDVSMTVLHGEPAKAHTSSFGEFFRLGIEHILTGYDHLLFLAGLLVVCVRLHTALIIITAFTLAHSVTLALAGLNIFSLPSRIVEPCIAATIVWVGFENLWRARGGKEPSGRCLLTFAFGLMHGFGFADALREAGLPSEAYALIKPLLAFNLGVETGQLAVALVFLPLLFMLRRQAWFLRIGVNSVSLLVCGLGGWWLIERLFA